MMEIYPKVYMAWIFINVSKVEESIGDEDYNLNFTQAVNSKYINVGREYGNTMKSDLGDLLVDTFKTLFHINKFVLHEAIHNPWTSAWFLLVKIKG